MDWLDETELWELTDFIIYYVFKYNIYYEYSRYINNIHMITWYSKYARI